MSTEEAARLPRAVALDRRGATPLWAQLLEDLVSRSQSGEFDEWFPGELSIADEYGVSRNTVRETLRRLRADGLVVAGRGRRPRLCPEPEIEQPLGALYSLFSSVEATGLEQRSTVRALEVRTDSLAADKLGVPQSTEFCYLERLRLAGPDPLALDRVWMPLEIAEPLLGVDFSYTAFYDELDARAGIRLTGGQEVIRAVLPAAGERSLLAIGARTAVFSIERVGYLRDRPIEWRRTLVRGDRFKVVAEFSGRSGYRVEPGAARL